MKLKRAHPDLSDGKHPPPQDMHYGYDLVPEPTPVQFQTRATFDELWADNKQRGPRFSFEKSRI